MRTASRTLAQIHQRCFLRCDRSYKSSLRNISEEADLQQEFLQQQFLQELCKEVPEHPIAAACLLERLPVVTPEDPLWATEFYQWQEKIHQQYRKQLPKVWHESELTAQDEVEWQPAPRVTSADRDNDTKSLWRKLDRRLFLLVKSKGTGGWQLPSRKHEKGKSIKETAQSALSDNVSGNKLWKTFFIGHMPCGHWQSLSGSTFIHKAQLIKGDVATIVSYSDYAWLCREEVLDKIEDEKLKDLFVNLLPKL